MAPALGNNGGAVIWRDDAMVIVALLGLTCAVQRLRTGSLWLPMATHWLTVVVWNLFLGRNLEF